MKKIQKVVLKDIQVGIGEDGEFQQVVTNEKTVPCFLTNYALKLGSDIGYIKGSLVADLLKLQKFRDDTQEKGMSPEAIESLDEAQMQRVIYLGLKGADKTFEHSFDAFLERYHYTFEETTQLYMSLVMNLITSDPNKFAKDLQKSTKKEKKE